MKNMRKTTLVWFTIFFFFLLVLVIYKIYQITPKEKPLVRGKLLVYEGGEVRLEWKDGRWMITKPRKFPVDSVFTYSRMNLLEKTKVGEVIDHGHWKDYKIGEKKIKLISERDSVVILPGKEGPYYRSFYVAFPNDSTVYLAYGTSASYFLTRFQDWRYKKLTMAKPAEIDSIVVYKNGKVHKKLSDDEIKRFWRIKDFGIYEGKSTPFMEYVVYRKDGHTEKVEVRKPEEGEFYVLFHDSLYVKVSYYPFRNILGIKEKKKKI
ncbi:hypothetical protein DRQ16_00850 [bacterium]|nr:MAG: hypothetical protein DRQ16_00850 [bacterium]